MELAFGALELFIRLREVPKTHVGPRETNPRLGDLPAGSILQCVEERLSCLVIIAHFELRDGKESPHQPHRLGKILRARELQAHVQLAHRLLVPTLVSIVGRPCAQTKDLKPSVPQLRKHRKGILDVVNALVRLPVLDEHCSAICLNLSRAHFVVPGLIKSVSLLIVNSAAFSTFPRNE